MLAFFNFSQNYPIILLFSIFFIGLIIFIYYAKRKLSVLQQQTEQLKQEKTEKFDQIIFLLTEKFMLFEKEQQREQHALRELLQKEWSTQRNIFDQHILQSIKILQESIQLTLNHMNQGLMETLKHALNQMGQRIEQLTRETGDRLRDISQQVNRQLMEGFEKTNTTFSDIIQRLLIIDHAQKNLSELSNNIVSLQEILNDKSARGSFGEVQLAVLVNNMLPPNCVAYQHQLSNGKRADCMLFLPEPTGNIVIDAKFPLENYRRSISSECSESDKRGFEQQFRQDIKKHVQDIASKYIIAGETADGAILFIPAEAVFAHIHARYPDLIEYAHRAHVWLVSPTTLMAVLTTARAVLKDQATREQVHVIRNHLNALAKDFDRFQKRMHNLEKHIDQAHEDVREVNVSARKITSRFQSIEKAELSITEESEKRGETLS